jgi:hypothetical protein
MAGLDLSLFKNSGGQAGGFSTNAGNPATFDIQGLFKTAGATPPLRPEQRGLQYYSQRKTATSLPEPTTEDTTAMDTAATSVTEGLSQAASGGMTKGAAIQAGGEAVLALGSALAPKKTDFNIGNAMIGGLPMEAMRVHVQKSDKYSENTKATVQGGVTGMNKGAVKGASVGMTVGGPLGALIGAVGGGIVGGVSGAYKGKKTYKAERDAAARAKTLEDSTQRATNRAKNVTEFQNMLYKVGGVLYAYKLVPTPISSTPAPITFSPTYTQAKLAKWLAATPVVQYKRGGKFVHKQNIIPNGYLHQEFNNLHKRDKGLPVALCTQDKCKKVYEIEREEWILNLAATEQVEALVTKLNSNPTPELYRDLGALVKRELLDNTYDYTKTLL